MAKINGNDFAYSGNGSFKINETKTRIDPYYEDKIEYKEILKELQDDIDALQSMMYAHDRYGMLVVFQAMDAAGKDGTMKRVFSNVHPMGTGFYSFKRPSEKELDHDYMWRCYKELPERGKIKVFNRSYYEEVLVVKVHSEILTQYQKIPEEISSKEDVWEKRYQDIKNFEEYLSNNGIVVVKFFLNVSKQEQGRRLIARIEEQEKNWKFEEGDIKERAYWNDYQHAYEDLINKTSSKNAPWHIVPADDKKNMRLIVAQVIKEKLKSLDIHYPETTDERQAELLKFIGIIEEQDRGL